MGWDVELRSQKTGKTMTLANAFYKRGSNVRAELSLDGKRHPVVEAEADFGRKRKKMRVCGPCMGRHPMNQFLCFLI